MIRRFIDRIRELRQRCRELNDIHRLLRRYQVWETLRTMPEPPTREQCDSEAVYRSAVAMWRSAHGAVSEDWTHDADYHR